MSHGICSFGRRFCIAFIVRWRTAIFRARLDLDPILPEPQNLQFRSSIQVQICIVRWWTAIFRAHLGLNPIKQWSWLYQNKGNGLPCIRICEAVVNYCFYAIVCCVQAQRSVLHSHMEANLISKNVNATNFLTKLCLEQHKISMVFRIR